MSDKLWGWPESTCVGCGRRIPAGTQQKCYEMPDGLCNWHVPAALQSHIARAESINQKMLQVLNAAKDLLEFHEGSAKLEFDRAFPTIRVKGEDWQNLLNSVRAAIAEAEAHP